MKMTVFYILYLIEDNNLHKPVLHNWKPLSSHIGKVTIFLTFFRSGFSRNRCAESRTYTFPQALTTAKSPKNVASGVLHLSASSAFEPVQYTNTRKKHVSKHVVGEYYNVKPDH